MFISPGRKKRVISSFGIGRSRDGHCHVDCLVSACHLRIPKRRCTALPTSRQQKLCSGRGCKQRRPMARSRNQQWMHTLGDTQPLTMLRANVKHVENPKPLCHKLSGSTDSSGGYLRCLDFLMFAVILQTGHVQARPLSDSMVVMFDSPRTSLPLLDISTDPISKVWSSVITVPSCCDVWFDLVWMVEVCALTGRILKLAT